MRVFRKLAQLLDVNVDSVADGDALVYDAGTQTWVPGAGGGGGGAPTDATYITQTANGDLENEQALSALSTGLVKVTNGTGVLSTATGGTDYANASHQHAGEDITSGTVADARIASTIARDSEVTAAISAHESDTTNVHGIADTSVLETTSGSQAKVDAHVNDTSAAHAADAISASSTTLSGTGTDVQAVLEELDNLLDDHSSRHEDGGADEISIAGLSGTPAALQSHLDDTSDAHDASAISVADGDGNFTATDVEGVLAELADSVGGGGGGGVPMVSIMCFEQPPSASVPTFSAWLKSDQSSQNQWTRFAIEQGSPGPSQNDYIEWPVSLKPGTYNLLLNGVTFSNGAIITFSLDGVSIGTIDQYTSGPFGNAIGTITGFTVSTDGFQLLRLTAATKNGSSSGYAMRLGALYLTRTGS